MTEKCALFVGINEYDHAPNLSDSVLNATTMQCILEKNADGTPNYACRTLTSTRTLRVTHDLLRQNLYSLFLRSPEKILLYFCGRGNPHDPNGHLMTSDGTSRNLGISMADLFDWISKSRAHEIILILDCWPVVTLFDMPSNLAEYNSTRSFTHIREDVSILSISRLDLPLIEDHYQQNMFTSHIVSALDGGAADIRGFVSPTSIYKYIEEMRDPWETVSFCKCYTTRLSYIRRCKPKVKDEYLRELPDFFPEASSYYQLNPSFIKSDILTHDINPAVFEKLSNYHTARLIEIVDNDEFDIYYAAMRLRSVRLTTLGHWYWRSAREGRF